MGNPGLEIACTACGAETFVRREAVYDGFKKTGEAFVCVACGHRYATEAEVPYRRKTAPKVFSDDDKTAKVEIFTSDERGKNCRYCRHYTVNPFTQRCGRHNREVQATDCCRDFSARPGGEEPASAKTPARSAADERLRKAGLL